MNYLQISAKPEPKAARFGNVEGFPKRFNLGTGVAFAGSFPPDAVFRANEAFPGQIALFDFIPTREKVLVVSEKVRDLLEKESVPDVEYLAVSLINLKGRKEKGKYFMVNPLAVVDCADPGKTKYKPNAIDKGQWTDVTNLTILEKKIPRDAQLFMVKHIVRLTLVRRDLADKLKAAKLKGFALTELDQYRWG